VKFNDRMASSIRRRVSSEIVRFPDRAYETVLRDTPAAFATSPMVATCYTLSRSNRFDEPVRRL
jgi:hypothetical protein